MPRLAGILTAIALGGSLLGGAAQADEAVREAQSLLLSLGYQPGPVDGAIGKRTVTALEDFLAAQGLAFDGKIDDGELAPLRSAVAEFIPTLKYPGMLFDPAHGKGTSCNALKPSRFHEGASGYASLEPIEKLNDSVSIGGSSLWDQIDPWLKMVLTEAAFYNTSGDEAAGELALSQLEKWANAKAVLATPIDHTYSGGGNRGNYRPSASAPVLDMENAAQLGYAVYYAIAMLDGLPTERLDVVRHWADELTERFGGAMGDSIFNRSPSGIWRLEARPLLARAILDGDADAYRDYVEAYYSVIRKVVSSSGALLKNANRGDRALHYQSQGLLSIAAVLDIVEQQGGKVPPDIEAKFHQAVTFMLDADRDNNVILGLAREGYNNSGDGTNPARFYRDSAEHYWWMYYYLSRYPETENAARLRHLIATYDTFEASRERILSTTWVPYPINCYRPFDMSEQAVAEAAKLVASKFPPLEEVVVEANVLERGAGGVTSDRTLEATSVTVRESWREKNFVEYELSVAGVMLDGVETRLPRISVFTDFRGSAEQASNLQLFRLVFYRNQLGGEGSRSASYLKCGDLSASVDGGDEMLKLHVGHGAEKNECLLSKMDEADRDALSAVLTNFGKLLEKADSADAAKRLRELHDLVS